MIEFNNVSKHYVGRAALDKVSLAGHMKAPRYLGLMYLNGEGVAQNVQTAFAYFTQAA